MDECKPLPTWPARAWRRRVQLSAFPGVSEPSDGLRRSTFSQTCWVPSCCCTHAGRRAICHAVRCQPLPEKGSRRVQEQGNPKPNPGETLTRMNACSSAALAHHRGRASSRHVRVLSACFVGRRQRAWDAAPSPTRAVWPPPARMLLPRKPGAPRSAECQLRFNSAPFWALRFSAG